MSEQGMVELTLEEYEELKQAADFLSCLECLGVDNWQGYEEAQEMYRESE